MRIIGVIDRTEEVLASLCLALMVLIIGIQVFNRYVLGSSLVWSEELGRYLFIWAVYIGCAYATKEDRHLGVTIVQNFAPDWLKKPVRLIADAVTLVFCGFCFVWGIQMVPFLMQTGQRAPALEIPMYWVYLALPVGMLLMGVRVLERSVRTLLNKSPPSGGAADTG